MCFKKKKAKTQHQEKVGLLWSINYDIEKTADAMRAYAEKYNDDSLDSTIKMLDNVAHTLHGELATNNFFLR